MQKLDFLPNNILKYYFSKSVHGEWLSTHAVCKNRVNIEEIPPPYSKVYLFLLSYASQVIRANVWNICQNWKKYTQDGGMDPAFFLNILSRLSFGS